MLTKYFAYGSNMDVRQMLARCPSSRCLGSARLDGYRLAFTRRSVISGSGVADVVPAAGDEVWGVVYELDERDLEQLDRKEGLGWAYTRQRGRVHARDGSHHDAIFYTVLAKEHSEVAPSGDYIGRLVAAAERQGFPRRYLASLAEIASRQD